MFHCPTRIGRGERIRTSGPCLPKAVLYQAELPPDMDGIQRRNLIPPARGIRKVTFPYNYYEICTAPPINIGKQVWISGRKVIDFPYSTGAMYDFIFGQRPTPHL